jgi:hypothetical protein
MTTSNRDVLSQIRIIASARNVHGCVHFHRPELTTGLVGNKGGNLVSKEETWCQIIFLDVTPGFLLALPNISCRRETWCQIIFLDEEEI